MGSRGTTLSVLALRVSDPTPERARGLLAYLTRYDADVLVLTAVGDGHGATVIQAGLRTAGYRLVGAPRPGGREVLVTGRRTVVRADPDAPAHALGGRVVPVVVGTPAGDIRLAAVHGTSADPVRHHSDDRHQRKRAWLKEFDAWVEKWLAGPPMASMIIGDLEIVPASHDTTLRHVLPEELDVYTRLTGEYGLSDLYDLRHPGDATPSWVDRSGRGCRYDHAFATAELSARLADCRLDPAPRTGGLTDHSALVVDLLDRPDITLREPTDLPPGSHPSGR